jgi:hypothetical protein
MEALVIIELILVFGGVLAFAFWELYSLRRDRKRSRSAEPPSPPTRTDQG